MYLYRFEGSPNNYNNNKPLLIQDMYNFFLLGKKKRNTRLLERSALA